MSVKDKTVVVTGANTGIGFETAATLAGEGAHVVLTARDAGKGAAAVAEIERRHPGSDVTVMSLDLARLADVRRFASDLAGRYPRLDVLVNNAGLILGERSTTQDGFETTFQVNHLGPFLLTNLLLPNIKAAAPSRIVNVASIAHRWAKLDFDDLHSEKSYRKMRVYGTTKLCNILFTHELARRLGGTGITANALHPGNVRSGFGKDGDTRGFFALGVKINVLFSKSPARGAGTSIFLASSPLVAGTTGGYFVNSKPSKPSTAARDDEAARKLWERSAELVGL